jgi:hypothetical protein
MSTKVPLACVILQGRIDSLVRVMNLACNASKSWPWRHFPSVFLGAACIVSSCSGWIPEHHLKARGIHHRSRAHQRRPRRCPQYSSLGSSSRIVVHQITLFENLRMSEPRNSTSDLNTIPGNETRSTADTFMRTVQEVFFSIPMRSILFSFLMAASGAILGPFLDSYHSVAGVLQYDAPITLMLWGTDSQHPALVTTHWVPGLFGLAAFLIGWLYILFDAYFSKTISTTTEDSVHKSSIPSPPTILLGIALFTFQYWWSAVLYHAGVDRIMILS